MKYVHDDADIKNVSFCCRKIFFSYNVLISRSLENPGATFEWYACLEALFGTDIALLSKLLKGLFSLSLSKTHEMVCAPQTHWVLFRKLSAMRKNQYFYVKEIIFGHFCMPSVLLEILMISELDSNIYETALRNMMMTLNYNFINYLKHKSEINACNDWRVKKHMQEGSLLICCKVKVSVDC